VSVKEIEAAIARLAPSELAELAEWFQEFHQQAWDKQIQQNVKAGKLDALIEQANQDFDTGRCKPL
jgi:hypothetical protein